MLYVVARSVREGRAAGIISSFGIAAGAIVHTLAVALGLAGLLRAVLLASGAGAWSRERFGESALLRRVTGVLSIGLGVRLALLERR